MLLLGDIFPDFTAETNFGTIKFHEWLQDSWAVLFSHPADFTPVCTTEVGKMAVMTPEFEKRGVKIIAISCDSVASHKKWIKDICAFAEFSADRFPFPIIGDESRELATKLGMIDPDEKDKDGLPLTCRAVFVIGPDKRLKLSILYPATTGRNFTELLRVIDSLQLTMNKKVATPVDWQPGDQCMVLPNIKEEELAALFPKGVTKKAMPSGIDYLRYTPQP
ncbi:peroxiredoxin-6 [Trichonephila clavipes]|nr:peroxiredoxin-6 [Trichonephila clavipes]